MISATDTIAPVNLAGLSRAAMQGLFADLGEKPFRAGQVMKWIHQRGVLDIDAMTDLSRPLRESLKRRVLLDPADGTLPILPILSTEDSADGCRKWLLQVGDSNGGDNRVETVFIPEAGRGTLCISTQAGCALDCSFCATGKQGFAANLSAAQIVGQLWRANRELSGRADNEKDRADSEKDPVTNVVFMGMGEPLLNFEPVMEAIDIMLDDWGYGLSKRRVTISTAGVVPAIERMKGRTQACLAVSLHAPDDELRSRLMPINRRYPIRRLLDAVADYMASLPDRRVPVMEYTLIKGINDHREHARELARLLQNYPCKINLIPFNPFKGSDFKTPAPAAVSRFRDILRDAGFTVTLRSTRAADIHGACGQLVGEVQDRTRRRERLRINESLIATASA